MSILEWHESDINRDFTSADVPDGQWVSLNTILDIAHITWVPKVRADAFWTSFSSHYAASHGEGRLVCEWLERHVSESRDYRTVLKENGFVEKHRDADHIYSFERRIGSGAFRITVWDDAEGWSALHLTYDPPRATRWFNLMRLTARAKGKDKSDTIDFTWPNRMTNPLGSFASAAVEYANLRATNGPRRYQKVTVA